MRSTLWKRTLFSARYTWIKSTFGYSKVPLWVGWRGHSSNSFSSNPTDETNNHNSRNSPHNTNSGTISTDTTSNVPPSSSDEGASSTKSAKTIHICVHSVVESKTKRIQAPVGMTLMEAIRDIAKLDIEASCDGCCACSTCHVIFTTETYVKLREPPTEEELDMLDLAPSATKSSRLSCQVRLTEEMDGIEVSIPDEMEP
ncbi:unnamed protein product [Phytomonas sp. Hart1]|nr:unnamed protein product [Phytomonas sp. Hart1]|eukprot:CCW69626.1 unnamed protein product [Phytomonas sp. isolate Hart1]